MSQESTYVTPQAVVKVEGHQRTGSTDGDPNRTGNTRKYEVVDSKSVGEFKGQEIKMVPWGKENDWPNQVIVGMAECGTGKKALRFSAKSAFGMGVELYKKSSDNGKKLKSYVSIDDPEAKEIKAFFAANKIDRYLRACIEDHEWFFISFSEIIFSKDGATANKIRGKEAVFCRVTEKVTVKAGKYNLEVSYLMYSDRFLKKESVTTQTKDVSIIPIIDPFWTDEEVKALLKTLDEKKMVYMAAYPTAGRFYYPDADWHSVVRNQWVDITAMVPSMKAAIMRNQMTLKYHIHILKEYWEEKFPKTDKSKGWAGMSFEDREKAVQETLTMINDLLSSSKNAGKSINSPMEWEQGKLKKYWEIEPIDDKLKDGAYIPDSEAANTEILFAIGVDPSLIGHGSPGGKLGAGSGSDKREAFNIFVALKYADRQLVLEPLNWIKDYNGWPNDIHFGFENIQLETLDKNPTGQKSTIS